MDKELALKLEIRRKIYNHILKSPGLHEREISRELNIPLSTLDYHLFYLKKRNLVTTHQDKGYTRYYSTGKVSMKDKQVLSILRQRVPRQIVLFLLLHPFSSHNIICDHLGVAPSTTSFHLNKLVGLDVVERKPVGRETSYTILDSEYLSDLLITYKKSFLDKSVDSFIDTWFELHPRYLKKQKKKDD